MEMTRVPADTPQGPEQDRNSRGLQDSLAALKEQFGSQALLEALQEMAPEAVPQPDSAQLPGPDSGQTSPDQPLYPLEALPVGTCRITPLPEGRLLYGNPALAEIFGFPGREALKSLRLIDLLDDYDGRMGDPTLALKSLCKEALAPDSPASGVVTCREVRAKRPDGRVFWVAVAMRRALGQLPDDPEGNPVDAIDCFFWDIEARKAAEDVMARRHDLLQSIIEFIPSGIALYDQDLNITLSNNHLREILDLPDSLFAAGETSLGDIALFNAGRGEYGEGDPHELAARAVEQARRFEASHREIWRPDGSVIDVHGVPLPHGGFLTVYTDITERRRAEEENRQRTEILNDVLENLPGGVSLFGPDLQLKISNRRFRELLDFPDSMFESRTPSFEDFIRFNAERGDYGEVDIEEKIEKTLARARSPIPHVFERERASGTILEIRGQPTADGGFVSIYTDITSRKKAEAEARRYASYLQQVLESMTQGVCVFNEDLRIAFWNSAFERTLRLPEGFFAHNPGFEDVARYLAMDGFYGPGDVEDHVEQAQAIARAFETYNMEQTLDGGRTIAVQGSPMEIDSSFAGFCTSFTDITAWKRAEIAASLASEAKSTFLATMSHEIRTPLNGIVGNLELLGMSSLDEDQTELVRSSNSAARILLGIIGDILDFSKIEAGKLEVERTECPVRDVVAGVSELFSAKARQKDTAVDTLIAPEVPKVIMGDPLRLRQVLMNLMGNAEKFTRGGRIGLTVLRERTQNGGDWLRFMIDDTGPGFEEIKGASLFDAFTQEDGSTTREFGGTGLGLAICRNLVVLMGGEIGCDGLPGAGATFWFRLPVEVVEPFDKPRLNLKGMSVLLVTSERRTEAGIGMRLQSLGADLHISDSLKSGHDAARERKSGFDAIVVDEKLPDGSGISFPLSDERGVAFLLGVDAGNPRARRRTLMAGFSALIDRNGGLVMLTHAVASQLGREQANPYGAELDEMPGQDVDLPPWMSGHRVLIIDDMPMNRNVAQRQFAKLGLESDTAENGLDGMQKIQKELPGHYALILVDGSMPVMDGFGFIAAFREYEAEQKVITGPDLQQTPVIALTAHAMSGDRQRFLEAGMNDYLTKPVTIDRLAEVLREWLPEQARSPGLAAAPDSRRTAGEGPVDLAALSEIMGEEDPAQLKWALDLFVETVQPLVGELAQAVRARDEAEAGRLAHALKSASRNAGCARLGNILEDLEMRARSRDGQPASWSQLARLTTQTMSGFLDVKCFVADWPRHFH